MDLNQNRIHIWNPLLVFGEQNEEERGEKENEASKNALIILNQPITRENESKLVKLWSNSSIRICVDGGMNRLHEWAQEQKTAAAYVPDFICGDLDSIDPLVLDCYLRLGSKCVCLNNQDLSDFTKTLRFLVSYLKNGLLDQELFDISSYSNGKCLNRHQLDELRGKQCQIENVYCFCDYTGRLDHALSNLHSLYDECLSNVNCYLVSPESLTFLLRKGQNIVFVDDDVHRGRYCGLVPLAQPVQVSTYGLKWNLNRQTIQFGKFISSSNEFDDSKHSTNDQQTQCVYETCGRKHVFIETNESLLWTMSINV
jgi:thiamine pyrophosphokinase